MIVFVISVLFKGIVCALSLIFFTLTVEKIRWVLADILCTCRVDLRGKVVLITNGTGGIGFETAKILAKRGATVVIASRNVAKSEAAVRAIIDATGNTNVEYKPLDLGRFSSIKQFADEFNRSYERLDVFIINSDTARTKQSFTEDGIETVMQTNHVGPTYLATLLFYKLIASKPSRMIFVSSIAHKSQDFDLADVKGLRRLNFRVRYANSMLANLLVTRALSKILPEGVTVNSLHPGTVAVDVSILPEILKRPVLCVINFFLKTAEECAQTPVHLAMALTLAAVTGQYFDECRIAKTHKVVTDELAGQVWNNTLALIEETTKNLENLNEFIMETGIYRGF